MKKELTAGNLEIATEFFYNLTEITGRLKDSSCQNLVDYAVTSQEYWFKALSDLLVRYVLMLHFSIYDYHIFSNKGTACLCNKLGPKGHAYSSMCAYSIYGFFIPVHLFKI